MAYDLIICGQLCADFFPDTSHLPISALSASGKLFEIDALEINLGGGVGNTGIACHILGLNVGLMATVGDDLVGQIILDRLEQHAPHLTEMVEIQQNKASAYSIILSPENTDRIILTYAGHNATFDAQVINFEHIRPAKLFHLAYPTLLPRLFADDGAMTESIFRRVHEIGVITSLDLTLPDKNSPSGQADWETILRRSLPYVDVFIPSIEEIVFMLRRNDYDRWNGSVIPNITLDYLTHLASDILDMGSSIVGFKLGDLGLYLRSTDDRTKLLRFEKIGLNIEQWQGVNIWQPAFEVDVVGTTGAGDCAYAGFLSALLHQLDPQDAIKMACALGACSVEAHSSNSGLLSWDDTRNRITSGWGNSRNILF